MRKTTSYHPSNTLYANEVSDFVKAMSLVVDECNHEAANTPEADPEVWTEDQRNSLLSSLKEYKACALKAAGIYQRAMAEAEKRVVAELRAAGEDMQIFADALESGDYSHLAI